MTDLKNQTIYLEENTIRIVAFQVVIFVLLTLLSGWHFLALALAADFAIRAFTAFPSPLGLASKAIVARLNLKPVRIFAAPKKFAATVGVLFSLAVFLLFHFNLNEYAYVVGGALVIFALLESVFKICVGCYVYDWLIVPFLRK